MGALRGIKPAWHAEVIADAEGRPPTVAECPSCGAVMTPADVEGRPPEPFNPQRIPEAERCTMGTA